MRDTKPKKIVPPYMREGYEPIDEYLGTEEGDRKILARLVEMGSDLGKPRHSIHYFYFESEDSARVAAQELGQMGFAVGIGERLDEDRDPQRWPVTADRIEVINQEVIAALRAPLTEIAVRNRGEYDGWEAQVG
jgi:regulator of RNase E activity RraB